MEITKQDIIMVIKDILTEDAPFWDLNDNYFGNGLDDVESKEFIIECLNKAIEIIDKTGKSC